MLKTFGKATTRFFFKTSTEAAEHRAASAGAHALGDAAMHTLETDARKVAGSELKSIARSEVSEATSVANKQRLKELEIMARGSNRRNVLIGLGVAAGGAATAYATVAGANAAVKASQVVTDIPDKIEKAFQGLHAPDWHLPSLPDPTQSFRGANPIGAITSGAQTGVTIIVVLGGIVIAYEAYRFLN